MTAPTIQGDPQTSGYADDPVNTTTGNFVEPETDLSFDGGAASLGFDRVYNSLSTGIGAFGPGWASTADQRLLLDDDGATWIQPSGRHILFPRLAGGWDRAHNDTYWLHTTTDTTGPTPGAAGGAGVFVVSDNAGGRWVFDRAGRPVSVSRGPGTRVDHRWDGDRLVGLTHERGRAVTIEWNDHHTRITALTANDGRRVDYTYDPAGRLTEARTAGGGARRYGWNEQGLIATVTDPDGVVETANTYNEHGQVTSQRSRFGRLSHYTYLPGNITQVADGDGGRANTWIHDQTGRLVGMVDTDGNRQSIGWDQWGNRVQITGRDGRTTVYRYDTRGRLITRQEASGARTDYEWDGLDRVVRVTVTDTTTSTGKGGGAAAGASDTTSGAGDRSGGSGNTSSGGVRAGSAAATGGESQSGRAVTSYGYEGAGRNPSTVTDPEGGVSRLVWDQNLLTEVVDPAGVRVRLGYDGHGDLVSAMNADGDTARLVRDGAGRVVAAVTPLGHRTEYRYDEAGRLASRRDPDGALWRYEHTTGGRLSAVVDPRTGVAGGTGTAGTGSGRHSRIRWAGL